MFYRDVIRKFSDRKVAIKVNAYPVGDHEPKARLMDALEFVKRDDE